MRRASRSSEETGFNFNVTEQQTLNPVSSSRLRVAVIGVGHLGEHHARLLAAMDHVDLVGVVDTKPGRADEIAAKYGTRAFRDAADVRSLVDAVTVAVPTESHVDEIGRASCRERGAG